MERIKIKTGYSQIRDEEKAVQEVFEKIKQENMTLIVLFPDAEYNQLKINEAWKKALPSSVPFIGSSSCLSRTPVMEMVHVITSDGYKNTGITAMSISSDKIKVAVKLIKEMKTNWEKNSEQALREAAAELKLDLKKVNPKKHFGLLLCDGMAGTESYILEKIYAMSGLLMVGGGSSGGYDIPNNTIRPGYVHSKEGAFIETGVIALFESEIPFKLDIATSFVPTNKKLTITKCERRIIHEFNGKPATEEYAKTIGVPEAELTKEGVPNFPLLLFNPLGLLIKERAFIRSPYAIMGKSILVAADVKGGEALYLMTKGDLVGSTQKRMAEIKKALKEVSGMIVFDCSYREVEAKALKVADELFKAMNIAPMTGLNSLGEYYGWLNMNQTLTILAFGK